MTCLIDDLRKIDIIPPYYHSSSKEELRIDFEYLVHGPVRGDALFTVKLNDLWMHGFDLFRSTVPASATALQRLQVSDPSAIHSAVRFARVVLKDAPQSNSHLFYFLAATCLAYTITADTWLNHSPTYFTRVVQSSLGGIIPVHVSEVFYDIAMDFQPARCTDRPPLESMVQFDMMRERQDTAEKLGRALARLGDAFLKPEVLVNPQDRPSSTAVKKPDFGVYSVFRQICKPMDLV